MTDPISVVIIEDDPMVLEVNIQYVGTVEGFRVIGTAGAAREGLEIVRRLEPDLTILDIYLPDQNGVEVLRQIRSLKLKTDVLMVTAARDVATIQEVFRYGAVDYIVKPFRLERIQSALTSYSRMRRQLESSKALDQSSIDRLTRGYPEGGPEDQTTTELPKGLAEVTLKQVLQYLAKSTAAHSAEEVAEAIGISRVTSRRYLEYLWKNGTLELEARYGTVGRPSNYYRFKNNADGRATRSRD